MVSGRKAFSVPVGRLRNKNSRCRGSSSSRSCSRSKLLNRLLKKNNQELAFALAKQKERNKITTDDNVKLMTTLHDTRIEASRWKNKFLEKQRGLTEYRDSVILHIKEAVKYSVLLTESLKLAMTIPCPESSSAFSSDASSRKESAVVRRSSILSPLSLRVNPMVSGHTIKYPTVSLKRLDVEVVERIPDDNNEEASEEIVENEPSERSVPSSSGPRVGLSTCIEEDEDRSQSNNVSSSSRPEIHEDSFRRRTVSFRNRTLDKSKQMWQIEVADSISSGLNMEREEALSPLNKKECTSRRYSSDWECVAVPEGLNWLNPVVALDDISKFLRYSNSVNVLEMAQVGNKMLGVNRHHDGSRKSPGNEKENINSNEIASEPVKAKRITKRAIESTVGSEDPLEGSSWMYEHLFVKPSEEPVQKKSSRKRNKGTTTNNKKNTRKRNRDPEPDSSTKNEEPQKDIPVENKDSISPEKVTKLDERSNVEQEPLTLESQRKSSVSLHSNDICCESLNMAQIRKDLKNKLVVQSTPVCRKDSSSQKPIVSPSSMSPNFGSKDQSRSMPSSVSPKLSNSRPDDEIVMDSSPSPSSNDAKLLPKAFVTVRVKRLRNWEEPEGENVEVPSIGDPKIDSEIGHKSDSSDTDFNGFPNADKSSEKAKDLRQGIDALSTSLGFSTREGTSASYEFTGCSSDTQLNSIDSSSRPRRKAAPVVLKEAKLTGKMRREADVNWIDGSKKKHKKKANN